MATRPQQRANLQPENVDDDSHGQDRSAPEREGDGIDDELSEQELAALSSMRTGERDAEGREEPEPAGDDDGTDEPDADQDGVDADDTAAAAGDRDQGAGDDRGQQQEQRRPKTINYGRHQRELAKRDTRLTELEALLNTERAERKKSDERSTRLDERTKLLLDAINAKPKAEEKGPEDPEPDENEDPIAHASWTRRELRRTQDRIQRLEQGVTTDREQRQQESAEERELRDFTNEIQTIAGSNPDFADAFVHLRESRFYELGDIFAGIDINDRAECAKLSMDEQKALSAKIQQSFAQEQAMVYREAKRNSRSIEQTIMRLAKARGFTPKQREQQQQDDDGAERRERPQQREAGARRDVAPAARRQQAPDRSVSDEIDNIRSAAGASRSLSDAGGSPGGNIDLARLADMDDDDFADILNSMSKSKLDRLMGKQPN